MKVIGITGGVGAGKSTVLNLIKERCSCFVLMADEAAHEVKKKGQVCYRELVDLLGSEVLADDGEIDKDRMAKVIFAQGNEELLKKVNEMIHPRVKEYVLKSIDDHRAAGDVDYYFIEAALLIEDGYREICDELWYVYADEKVRADRLRRTRGYSDERIRGIMDKQNDDALFRKYCDRVIENNDDIEATGKQIDMLLDP